MGQTARVKICYGVEIDENTPWKKLGLVDWYYTVVKPFSPTLEIWDYKWFL